MPLATQALAGLKPSYAPKCDQQMLTSISSLCRSLSPLSSVLQSHTFNSAPKVGATSTSAIIPVEELSAKSGCHARQIRGLSVVCNSNTRYEKSRKTGEG